MARLARSLLFGFMEVGHPRMLWMMLWPVLVSAVLWTGLLIVLWAPLVAKVAALFQAALSQSEFLARFDLSDAVGLGARIALVILLVPLIQFTALLIIGVFGMTAMVDHVARRAFPDLQRRSGGTQAGSLANGIVAVAGLVGLGLLSLPLWLLPPLWPVIPVAIFGWMNQRVLRYDALAEHASAEEMQWLFRARRGGLLVLGALLALAAYVPVAGLFAPVVFGLAFIHYLLGALEGARGTAEKTGGCR